LSLRKPVRNRNAEHDPDMTKEQKQQLGELREKLRELRGYL
jgi:hypothetical protein